MVESLAFSQACQNNQQPILQVLKPLVSQGDLLLELGSGTGQHSVYFAEQMPDIIWQPSDRAINLPHIRAWQQQFPHKNNLPPLVLDIDEAWPAMDINHVFTANTFHIVSWAQVEKLFTKVAKLVKPACYFIIYGPFNYGGDYTSESNRQFDAMLRGRDPLSGIRHFEAVCELADGVGFDLHQDNAMPANNRCLVFVRR